MQVQKTQKKADDQMTGAHDCICHILFKGADYYNIAVIALAARKIASSQAPLATFHEAIAPPHQVKAISCT